MPASAQWTIGSKWVYEQTSYPNASFEFLELKYTRDTLINDVTCQVLLFTEFNIINGERIEDNSHHEAIVRYNGSTLDYVHRWTNEFHKVYDFDLEVGDTTEVYSYWHSFEPDIFMPYITVVIDSVGLENIQGTELKVQWVRQIPPFGWFWHHGKVVEGIGKMDFLFPTPGKVDPPPGGALICFSDDGLVYPELYACDQVTSTGAQPSSNDLRIYPNPTCDHLALTQQFDRITIYSITGVEILIYEQTSDVDVSSLLPGIYILTLRRNSTQQSTKFLKICR